MKIWGFEIKKAGDTKNKPTFITPTSTDGSFVIEAGYNSAYSAYIDVDSIVKTEQEAINNYRQIANFNTCDKAIDEIVTEAIIIDDEHGAVKIVLDSLEGSDEYKDKIVTEFEQILRLLDFNNKANDLFKRWYIDGHLYFFIRIDEEDKKGGIKELNMVDPRKIKKIEKRIKEIVNGQEMTLKSEKFYIFNDKGIRPGQGIGKSDIKIPEDSIVDVLSGNSDPNTFISLSHLHGAIRPVNILKMLEDAVVIYRVVRAPERRIFYVDVGEQQGEKAEQSVQNLMAKFRNNVAYDPLKGEIRDKKRHTAMLEDYWIPRRGSGKSTEVTTLSGAQNLGEITDLEYFKDQVYDALKVPKSRLSSDSLFNSGRSSEISNEEVKFNKYIKKLRKDFSQIFLQSLRVQLILKNIIKPDEWEDVKNKIRFDFIEDNHFMEMNQQETLRNRNEVATEMMQHLGVLYSREQIMREVLKYDNDTMELLGKEMKEDIDNGYAIPPDYRTDMEMENMKPPPPPAKATPAKKAPAKKPKS